MLHRGRIYILYQLTRDVEYGLIFIALVMFSLVVGMFVFGLATMFIAIQVAERIRQEFNDPYLSWMALILTPALIFLVCSAGCWYTTKKVTSK